MYSVTGAIGPWRGEINAYIEENWGGPQIVTLGNMFDSRTLPGFAAVEDGAVLGALLYRLYGDECEVAALFALRQGAGVGRALLGSVVQEARAHGCKRLWLVTTNDNTPAFRFYQKYGFTLKAAHIGSFERSKEMKGLDMDFGVDGIRIEHELELELPL